MNRVNRQGVFTDEMYIAGMEYLLQVAQQLALAHSLSTIQSIVRRAARELTHCDGATLVLLEGGGWIDTDEDASLPLWKGRSVAVTKSISDWAMQNRQPAIIDDICSDSRIAQEACHPAIVKVWWWFRF